jgi:hypothetical protein
LPWVSPPTLLDDEWLAREEETALLERLESAELSLEEDIESPTTP